jgi:hypothetical protein
LHLPEVRQMTGVRIPMNPTEETDVMPTGVPL